MIDPGANVVPAGIFSSKRSGSATERAPEPWLATVLRTVVHAMTGAAVALPLAVDEAIVASAAGAAAGSVLGLLIGRSRLRWSAIAAVVVGLSAIARVASHLAVDSNWLAPNLGPAGALRVGEVVVWAGLAMAVTVGLRALSARVRGLAVLEVAAVGLAFSLLVAAHRHGAINRPFEIADPMLARGSDPTWVFFAIGVAASLVVVLLLLSERNLIRAGLQILFAVVLVLAIFSLVASVGLPAPPRTAAGLGLRDAPSQDGRGRGDGSQGGHRQNEEMEFRDRYSNTPVPVAVVLLHDDYSPPTGIYYFRQAAFSQYNGSRLTRATRSDVDRDIAAEFPTAATTIAAPPPAGPDRLAVATTVALLADHTRPFALESPTALAPANNPDPRRFRRVYRADSVAIDVGFMSLLGFPAGAPNWSPEVWRHYIDGPTDPRYRELALRIIDEKLPKELREDAIAQALAIGSWLGERGTYSLRSDHATAEDPTAHFLFGDLTGYCVHFAHAAAYLMRSLGLPARVSTGYAAAESGRQGGSTILLSGQDSHAWAEIYVTDLGWVPIDVSPETVLSAAPAPPDPELQRLLGELLRGERPLPIDGMPRPQPLEREVLAVLSSIAIVAAYLVAAILALLVVIKVWRRLVPAVASQRALPRVVYRAELDRLAELGIYRRYGESRESFASRLMTSLPSFEPLTKAHVAAAFGDSFPDAGLRGRARQLHREVRMAHPWWRRVLGAMVPWSWLRAR